MAICRHITTNMLFRYLGNNVYENLYTGATGEIKPDHAQSIFKINLEATAIFNEYPMVEELVKRLKLVLDKK
jgi:hypothetical protein